MGEPDPEAPPPTRTGPRELVMGTVLGRSAVSRRRCWPWAPRSHRMEDAVPGRAARSARRGTGRDRKLFPKCAVRSGRDLSACLTCSCLVSLSQAGGDAGHRSTSGVLGRAAQLSPGKRALLCCGRAWRPAVLKAARKPGRATSPGLCAPCRVHGERGRTTPSSPWPPGRLRLV